MWRGNKVVDLVAVVVVLAAVGILAVDVVPAPGGWSSRPPVLRSHLTYDVHSLSRLQRIAVFEDVVGTTTLQAL